MQDSFQIRIATVDDAPEILNIYKGYVEGTAATFEHTVPTLAMMREMIETTLKGFPFLVAEREALASELQDDRPAKKIIGYSYAGSFRKRESYVWSVECSIYVSQDERKSGVGRALYSALEHVLREMGILNLYACVAFADEPDEHLTDASIRFHEKMGFSEIGRFPKCGSKFGKWYGILWMGKTIGEHATNHPAPRAFSEL